MRKDRFFDGYTPFSLIGQVAESSRYGHIVPAPQERSWAPPSYVSHRPQIDGTRFTFLGAERDRMFLPSGQERTAEFFDAEYVEVPGYGHCDVFWGRNAPRDVYPKIGAGLR